MMAVFLLLDPDVSIEDKVKTSLGREEYTNFSKG